MQRKFLLALFVLFVAVGGMSWLGQAEDQKSPDIQRAIPDGPLGDAIRLGRDLVQNTTSHRLSKPFVGNALNCTSCHLKNGTDRQADSFVGVATAYPAWSPREKTVITLEDRVLNCFMRSCNGIRPPLGSEVSVSIAAYHLVIHGRAHSHEPKTTSWSPGGPANEVGCHTSRPSAR